LDDAGPYIARKYRILYGPLDPKLIVQRLEACNFDVVGVEYRKRCIICENKSVHNKQDKHIMRALSAIDKFIEEAHTADNHG
jgi:hypothetical protein